MFEEAHFQNSEAARDYLEGIRWPDGPVCPHCGCVDQATKLNAKRRAGLYKCNACRKQFTVTVGTVFERSHIPLHHWLQAVYLLCSSKKGMSSHQLHRSLGVTYKTAWFMTHRIRDAMRAGSLAPMGGEGRAVEVDETYWGNIQGREVRPWRDNDQHRRRLLQHHEAGTHWDVPPRRVAAPWTIPSRVRLQIQPS